MNILISNWLCAITTTTLLVHKIYRFFSFLIKGKQNFSFSIEASLTCTFESRIRSIACQILSPNYWITSRLFKQNLSLRPKNNKIFFSRKDCERGRTFRSEKIFNSALSMEKVFPSLRKYVLGRNNKNIIRPRVVACARIVQQKHVILKALTPLSSAYLLCLFWGESSQV